LVLFPPGTPLCVCMYRRKQGCTDARTHTQPHIHTGRKRWVLFPPGTPKSLVKPAAWMAKKDREAIDWFLCHYRSLFPYIRSFLRETVPYVSFKKDCEAIH
jgi:hypothetical protein